MRLVALAAATALVLPAGASARLGAEPFGFWGGDYTTRTNEHVRVFSSPSYRIDPAVNQRWADFLASLVHGSELATVTVYRAPVSEVTRLCGGNVDVRGCYDHGRIVTIGEDADLRATAVLAHEYGHHIAANRTNAPWSALGWGTKRWSSLIGVCRHARAKEWWPGAEGPLVYFYNPGEAFAEAYRLLNERKLGLPLSPWSIVDDVFFPTARALTLLQQDVLDPWGGPSTVTRAGTFRAGGKRSVTIKVPTPRDGELKATVTGAAQLAGASGRLVCGTRTSAFRIVRAGPPGRFTLTLSRP